MHVNNYKTANQLGAEWPLKKQTQNPCAIENLAMI